MQDITKAKMLMAQSYGDYIDCGELQCTQLAEHAAYELGHPEWLDKETHWIWDLPIQLGKRLGILSPY